MQHARKHVANSEVKIILSYGQLGPPPSILGNENMLKSSSGVKVDARLGQPKPVKDSLAIQETAPLQQEMAGKIENFAGRLIEIRTYDVEPLPFSKVEIVPVLIKQVELVYPPGVAKIDGTTIIEGIVDVDGTMSSLRVKASSGSQLHDEAALEAARQYLFTPGRQKDKPIPVIVTIPFRFSRS